MDKTTMEQTAMDNAAFEEAVMQEVYRREEVERQRGFDKELPLEGEPWTRRNHSEEARIATLRCLVKFIERASKENATPAEIAALADVARAQKDLLARVPMSFC